MRRPLLCPPGSAMSHQRQLALLPAVALFVVATGCPAEKYQAAPDTSRVGADAVPSARDTAAVFAPVSDADVRMLMAMINGSEISAGQTAARKGIVGDVRTFASDMIADHTAMQQ